MRKGRRLFYICSEAQKTHIANRTTSTHSAVLYRDILAQRYMARAYLLLPAARLIYRDHEPCPLMHSMNNPSLHVHFAK